MKRLKQTFSLLALALTFGYSAMAQNSPNYSTYSAGSGAGDVKMNFYYLYGMPTGTFKSELVDNNSPRGFGADILYWFNPKWGVGGSFAYQDFYQKYPRDLYKLTDGSDISAVLSNSVQTLPIMAKAMFSPTADRGSIVQPYVSVGAGVNLVSYAQYLGEFTGTSETKAKFTAQAGAGVKIPFGKADRAGLLLGANYQFTPYNRNDISNLNTINLQAGLQFRLK